MFLHSNRNVLLRTEWNLARTPLRGLRSPRRSNIEQLSQPRAFQRLFCATSKSQNWEPSATSAQEALQEPSDFRAQLEEWDSQHGGPSTAARFDFENFLSDGDIRNVSTKMPTKDMADGRFSGTEKDEYLETDNVLDRYLKPGDVIEYTRQGREPILAVFVQLMDGYNQFFTAEGRWHHEFHNRQTFAIPGTVDPELIIPLIPFMPTSPATTDPKGTVQVPPHVAAPVRAILEHLIAETDRIYRTNSSVLDKAHSVLADETRVRMFTLTQAAKALLGPNDSHWTPSTTALLAVRKALHRNKYYTPYESSSHKVVSVLSVRSKKDVENVETVHEWLREYFESKAASATQSQRDLQRRSLGARNVRNFVEKARRLISHSRQFRDPQISNIGPTKVGGGSQRKTSGFQTMWGESFSDSDQQLINFLMAWVLRDQFQDSFSLHSACARLLQEINCYNYAWNEDLLAPEKHFSRITGRRTGMLFLQEIGVLAPWDLLPLYNEQLRVPTINSSRNLDDLTARAEKAQMNPDFRDSMVHARRDWGSTAVYCIDDASAQEIDDGISIEKVNEAGSEFWVHVHVANPTAFFQKTHVLASLAAHMTQTVYTPMSTYPMLPQWVAREHFGLKKDRPVITFSARIDNTGNVLETNIEHGIIRNVVSLTYRDVVQLLGKEPARKQYGFVVGGTMRDEQRHANPPRLSSDQLEDMRSLYKVAESLWKKRCVNGATRQVNRKPNVRASEDSSQDRYTRYPPSLERSRMLLGDPIIAVENSGIWSSSLKLEPDGIVGELMIIAGQTAASWCAERDIPIPYRGTEDDVSASASSSDQPFSTEELQTMISSYDNRGEVPPFMLTFLHMNSLGVAVTTSAPLAHRKMGVPSYAKATSPLRRFSDMIVHWQIEAAMRYESQTGRRFNANDPQMADSGALPFTKTQIQDAIHTLVPREAMIARAASATNAFLSIMALRRALQDPKSGLPPTFKLHVMQPSRSAGGMSKLSTRGVLEGYGISASFVEEPSETSRIGDVWEVKVDSVDLFYAAVHVQPIRFLSRLEGIGS